MCCSMLKSLRLDDHDLARRLYEQAPSANMDSSSNAKGNVISTVETRDWQCMACGWRAPALTWLSIDLVERPDLRRYLAEDSWTTATCSRCSAAVRRSEPLLVTRLAQAAPVLMALPEALLALGSSATGSNACSEAQWPLWQGAAERGITARLRVLPDQTNDRLVRKKRAVGLRLRSSPGAMRAQRIMG
jgi:hypothetical protein